MRLSFDYQVCHKRGILLIGYLKAHHATIAWFSLYKKA